MSNQIYDQYIFFKMHEIYDIEPKFLEESQTLLCQNRAKFQDFIRNNPSKGQALNYPDVIPPEDILAAVNSLRANPKSYIPFLKERINMFINDHEYRIGGKLKKLKNGRQQIQSCISFLEKRKPVPPLTYYQTIQISTNDHVMDMIANNYFYTFGKSGLGAYTWRIRRRIGYTLSCYQDEFIVQIPFSEGPEFIKLYLIEHLIDKQDQYKKSRQGLLYERVKYFSGTIMKDPVNNSYKGEIIISSGKAIQPKGSLFNNIGAEMFRDYTELLQIASSRILAVPPVTKTSQQLYWETLQCRNWIDDQLANSDYVKKVKKITKKNKGIFDLHINQCVIPEQIHNYPAFISAEEILNWINMARTSPLEIVPLLKKELKLYINNLSYIKNGKTYRTKQGKPAVTEAINFMQQLKPLKPVQLDECLCLAAIDQMMNVIGQYGADNTSVYERVKRRHGKQFSGNVQKLYLDTKFEQLKDLDIVKEECLKFIIDSGNKSRPNRNGILNQSFIAIGACIWREATSQYKTFIFLGEKHLEVVNFEGGYYKIMPKIDPAVYLQPPPFYNNNRKQNSIMQKQKEKEKKKNMPEAVESVSNQKKMSNYNQNDILSTISHENSPKKKSPEIMENRNSQLLLINQQKKNNHSFLINYNLIDDQSSDEVVQKIIKTRNKLKRGVKITQIIETVQFQNGTIKVSKREL